MKKDFWDAWKYKTEIENKAIAAVKKARELIIKSIPKSALIAIYIKGSFVRREMNTSSDVDIVPIVTENKYEKDVFSVNSEKIYPAIVVPLSILEFKENKLYSSIDPPDLRAKPDRFLRKIDRCRLIYGKPLDLSKFTIRNDKEIFKEEIKIVKDGYILAYEDGKISFHTLLKEVFWLAEAEQYFKGIEVKESFEAIANSFKNKGHIIHQALKIRKNTNPTEKEKEEFVKKLKEYMTNLK